MPELDPSYEALHDFFRENRLESNKKFYYSNKEFEKNFDKALSKLHSNKDERGGVAMAVFLRAIKYLFTAQNLLLDGHQEEARILLRNIVELGLLGFLIGKNEDVFKLWKACRDLRGKHENDGRVPYEKIKNKKFRLLEIIKANRILIDSDQRSSALFAYHGEFSENISHENIYTMIARIDAGDGKTELYIGSSAKSANNRIIKDLDLVNQLLNIIRDLKSELE
ncbi:MAG: hypothetical protein PHU04_04455 [Candidatus Peribacteraceae bacterium]|nr:hypothetical protein [Candidatus Peribacteraceae bacterium]